MLTYVRRTCWVTPRCDANSSFTAMKEHQSALSGTPWLKCTVAELSLYQPSERSQTGGDHVLLACPSALSPVRQKPGLNPGPFAWEANLITTGLPRHIVWRHFEFLNAHPTTSKQKQNNDFYYIRQVNGVKLADILFSFTVDETTAARYMPIQWEPE